MKSKKNIRHYSNKKFLILFDKTNIINLRFFSPQRIISKIHKSNKVFISTNIKDIKKFDYIFLIGFTKKIKLDNDKHIFTIHESDLPKGRGNSPLKWQIIKGKNTIICKLFKINRKIDGGDIYSKEKLKILKTDLFDEIKSKQMKITEKLITNFINNKKIKIIKQKGRPTYYRKITSEDDMIDPKKSLISQFDKIRSTNSEYDNYFYINKKKFVIKIIKK